MATGHKKKPAMSSSPRKLSVQSQNNMSNLGLSQRLGSPMNPELNNYIDETCHQRNNCLSPMSDGTYKSDMYSSNSKFDPKLKFKFQAVKIKNLQNQLLEAEEQNKIIKIQMA